MAMFDRLMAGMSPSAALRRAVSLTEQGDVKQAFPLLARAARAGIAEAEYRMGRCYLKATGVPPVAWKACAGCSGPRTRAMSRRRRNSPRCSFRSGQYDSALPDDGVAPTASLFATNEAVAPDYDAAVRWAGRPPKVAPADGQAVLGYILTSGPEQLRSLDEAHQWYERSAAAGCPQGALGFALPWHARPRPRSSTRR